MRAKIIWGYFLFTLFLTTKLQGDESLVQSKQEQVNETYIQSLASLVFHTQQQEDLLQMEETSSEEIPFSREEVSLLWDKVGQNLYQISTNIDLRHRAHAFAQAFQNYEQTQELLNAGFKHEAHKTIGKSANFLNVLWEEALELEKDPLVEHSLVLRKQVVDPNVEKNPYVNSRIKKQMTPYLLPLQHEMRSVLDSLFLPTRVTADREIFHQAGFKTIARRPRSYIRVASHPQLEGYLIKVYLDTVLQEKQHKASWEWLVLRCKGADKVRAIIQKQHLKHFVVADKWIYCLPPEPSPPRDHLHTRHLALLLVTDMQLASEERNYYAWSHYITKEHLHELYMIISHAKGSSYRPDNIAYTKDGKFAFIDTEYPSRGPDYKSIREYLNKEMRSYWDHLIKNGGR